MNASILGQPTREDLQTLDQLRRQLMPLIGVLDRFQSTLAGKNNTGQPIHWPEVQQTISNINNQLTNINAYINGTYRRTAEEVRNNEGQLVKDEDGNVVVQYTHFDVAGKKKELGDMHVFPMAPFPIMNEQLAGMALTLLEKRLGPTEEKWAEERVKKAAEFAHVPAEWGVVPRKVETYDENKEEDEFKEWAKGLPTKRLKGKLDEDQLMEMWAVGHKTAFDRRYQKQKQFGASQGGGRDEEEDEEDEDMEDVEGMKQDDDDDDEDDDEDEDSDEAASKAPPPVQLIQSSQPPVHKPIPGAPMLPLSTVHRFMSSGETLGPAGQR